MTTAVVCLMVLIIAGVGLWFARRVIVTAGVTLDLAMQNHLRLQQETLLADAERRLTQLLEQIERGGAAVVAGLQASASEHAEMSLANLVTTEKAISDHISERHVDLVSQLQRREPPIAIDGVCAQCGTAWLQHGCPLPALIADRICEDCETPLPQSALRTHDGHWRCAVCKARRAVTS